MKTILAVTSDNDDSTFEPLSRAIAARGGRLVRFDTEAFPTEAGLRMQLQDTGWSALLRLEGGEELSLEQVHAVWHRRLRPARRLPRGQMESSVFRACYREAVATLEGLLASLPIRVVDPPHVVARAENKTLQLAVARRAGLVTPDSLITNDPASVRAFHAHHGPIVTKLLDGFLVNGEDGPGIVPTSTVGQEDLEDLGGLSLAPGLFQGRIPKVMEARALVVGDRVMAAGFDSRHVPEDATDWRTHWQVMDHFVPVELPRSVREALCRHARAMDLHYGAADLILTPGGEWVFLEMNPCGEWGWLQRKGGLDPAGALAELLLE